MPHRAQTQRKLKTHEPPTERRLGDALLQALRCELREVPSLEIREVRSHEVQDGREIDLALDLRLPGETALRLIGEVKHTGEPRIARAAADRLFYITHRTCPGAYGVFLAPYISPEAAAICEADGFGYVDLAGNCLLRFGNVYIRREGQPNTTGRKRLLRSFYSPKAERVLRALLAEPGKTWKVSELAGAAAVSLGQAHNVKSLLQNREWLTDGVGGLRLREPEKLLTEWAASYRFDRSKKYDFHWLEDVGTIEAAIADTCAGESLRYAFTGFSGAARTAPHTRYQRVHAYVSAQGVAKLSETAGLKPVASGANVILLEPYDEGVYYKSQDGDGCVVSPVQLYLDLRALPGRGEDAAEFLLDTVLRPQW